MKTSHHTSSSVCSLVVNSFWATVLVALLQSCSASKQEPLRFAALGTQFVTAPAIVAVKGRRFNDKGVDVSSFDMSAGVFAKDAVVNAKADVAVVANTPIALAAGKGEDVLVLGRIMFTDKMHAIVSRLPNAAPAEPIGYIPGTSSEFFLHKVLHRESPLERTPSPLKLIQLRPPGVVPAFNSGSVASVSMWEPFVSDLSRSKSPPFGPLPGVSVDKHPGLYPFAFYIITSKRAWKARTSDILRFLETMRGACDETTANSQKIRAEMERLFGYPEGWLTPIWGDFDFRFSADIAQLRPPIENDAELAVAAGLLAHKPDVTPVFAVLSDVAQALNSTRQ